MAADLVNFVTLFSKNFPHILENIFFSMDYKSYKICLEVNSEWKELLTSERYITKGKTVFKEEITKDEEKLWNAAEYDNADEARRKLATVMVDVNCRSRFINWTPLHKAAERGHKEVVQLLIESGADQNVVDKRGRTSLHWAVSKGHKEVVQLLIENGADLNVADEEGTTPLHCAARSCNKEMVKLLIERGTDLNVADEGGRTPLHWAAERGCGVSYFPAIPHSASADVIHFRLM